MNSVIAENIYQEELYQIPGKVIVIVSKEWEEISSDEKIQLSKIMNALKINLDSICILMLKSISIGNLLPVSPSKVISFGVPFDPEISPYENIVLEGISVIKADALNILDDVKKRNLWLALKTMFNIQ